VRALSVIIPHFGDPRLLYECLSSLSLRADDSCEVIVVDNGSEENPGQALLGCSLPVRFLRLSDNRGFAGAVNAGALSARGDDLLVLNNDARLEPGTLDNVLLACRTYPDFGSFACRVMDADSPAVIQSAGLVFHRVLYGNRSGAGLLVSAHNPVPVFAPCGAAACYRRDMYLALGGLDETYFMYYEDVEFGLRMISSGHRTLYVPTCGVIHELSATSSRVPGLRVRHMTRNAYLTIAKTIPLRLILQNAAVALDFHAKLGFRLLSGKGRGAYLRGLFEFLLMLPGVIARRILHWRHTTRNRSELLEAVLYQGDLELNLPTRVWRYPERE